MNILIAEDEPKIAQLLKDYLQRSGFDTQIVADGNEVMNEFDKNSPDLILLDLMLPGKDGISICREIREQSNVPIIMVTARVDEIDRLLGLELGADDYICKPFSPQEVVARTRAVLRRTVRQQGNSEETSQHKSKLQINKAAFKVYCDGTPVTLTALEFKLLEVLAAHPGNVYSREQLMSSIYDDNRIVTERTIDTHIKNIRKKMQTYFPETEVIRAIYGLGYTLDI